MPAPSARRTIDQHTRSIMTQVDAVKEKLTSQEYLQLAEAVGLLRTHLRSRPRHWVLTYRHTHTVVLPVPDDVTSVRSPFQTSVEHIERIVRRVPRLTDHPYDMIHTKSTVADETVREIQRGVRVFGYTSYDFHDAHGEDEDREIMIVKILPVR